MNAKTDAREYRTLPAERKARRGEGGLLHQAFRCWPSCRPCAIPAGPDVVQQVPNLGPRRHAFAYCRTRWSN